MNIDINSPINLSDSEIVALNMFFKLQEHLKKPELLALINCPIEIP